MKNKNKVKQGKRNKKQGKTKYKRGTHPNSRMGSPYIKGYKPSVETRRKMRDSHKGKSTWNKGLKGEEYKSHFKKGMGGLFNSNRIAPMKGKKRLDIQGDLHFNKKLEKREKYRILAQKRLKENGIAIQFGNHEKEILDEWEKIIGYKIKRQFLVCGYYLDGYCEKLNLAFEIDEKYHKKKIEKDKERENNIRKKLKCRFIRIKDY